MNTLFYLLVHFRSHRSLFFSEISYLLIFSSQCETAMPRYIISEVLAMTEFLEMNYGENDELECLKDLIG